MKQFLFTILVFSFLTTAYSQDRPVTVKGKLINIHSFGKALPNFNAFDNASFPLKAINQSTSNYRVRNNSAITTIGSTTYDLQTNASIDDRIITSGTKTAAIWTYSTNLSVAAPDRGTGYNYFNGTAWGSAPSGKIETVRTGWPSIGITANGAEHVISHEFALFPLRHNTRAVAGTGLWTESTLPLTNGTLFNDWTRLATGGSDGNSLHLIDIVVPTGANNGTIYQGMDGPITYSRSEDAGATWNIIHSILPGFDSTLYATGVGADSYAIDASGATVAITAGRLDKDWAFWKSIDNGSTWTKNVIMEFPLPNFDWDAFGAISDINGDSIPDTISTVDGKVEILVDNNGMVHAWAGNMITWDTYPDSACVNDTCGLYLTLAIDGLLYWNESMDTLPPVIIAEVIDLNGNDTLELADNFTTARYGNGGMTTQPSAAIDAAGNIVLSYASFVENTNNGGIGNPQEFYSFRNNYMIGSMDGGMTWGDPINICDDSYNECVFASLSRNIVNGCVDVIWQQDDKAGIAVQAPNNIQAYHPFTFNDIIHDCVALSNIIVGVNEINKTQLAINAYPNPASDILNIDFEVEKTAEIRFEIINSLGQVIDVIESSTYTVGNHKLSLDVKKYTPGLYFITTSFGSNSQSIKFVIN